MGLELALGKGSLTMIDLHVRGKKKFVCPRCEKKVSEVLRPVGVFHRKGRKFLEHFPIGDLICRSCFRKLGLSRKNTLVPIKGSR